MKHAKVVGKREFIQHTSKYLKWVGGQDNELIITHHNKPDLIILKIQAKAFRDLRGFTPIKLHGDINEHILPEIDTW